MNLDLTLLLKVVQAGPKGWERLKDDGIRRSHFVNDGAVVCQWIEDRMEVADFPSEADLRGKFSDVDWPDAERYRYPDLVDGIRLRRKGTALSEGVDEIRTLLGKGQIHEAESRAKNLGVVGGDDVVRTRSLLAEGKKVKSRYEAAKAGISGIHTPWPSVTKMAGGLQRRSVTTLLGRPGGGKTTLALLAARHAWVTGSRVLFLSPEMDSDEIAEVFFTIHSGTPYGGVILGNLAPEVEARFYQTIDDFGAEQGFEILDSGDHMTPDRVARAIRQFRPDMVVVDSIYELFKDQYREELARLDMVTAYVKDASKILRDETGGIAILSTSQLKKGSGDGEEAGLDDGGMSDKFAMRSQNVFKVWMKRPEDENNHVRRISPLKVRRRADWKSVVMVGWDWRQIKFDEIVPKTREYRDTGDA